MADVACMSKNSLLRALKRSYGTSPMSYLNQFRLKRAKRLLDDQNLTITEVSFNTGFSDSNYFSRQFRRAYGVSPSEYRKLRKRAEDMVDDS